MISRFLFLILLILPISTALAQRPPSIGCVRNVSDWEAGTALSREGESRRECYVFYSPSFDGSTNRVNIDGRDYSVQRVSRRRNHAFDQAAGIRREYTVTIYRPRGNAFEVELWERHELDGEGSRVLGGMTVRRRGTQSMVRVEGYAGP